MELTAVSASNGILFQITLDAWGDRLFACDECISRNLLIHLNIAARELEDKLGRCFWERRVSVRITVLLKPQTQKLFVETLWFFPFRETFFVSFYLPIARGVRRVDFVDKYEITVFISSKFVFSVDENEPPLCRYLLSAKKELCRRCPYFFEKLFHDEPFRDHLLRGNSAVMGIFFGRWIKYRCR